MPQNRVGDTITHVTLKNINDVSTTAYNNWPLLGVINFGVFGGHHHLPLCPYAPPEESLLFLHGCSMRGLKNIA